MSLIKSLAKVSSFTLISRLLGFVRDLVLAHLFGADGKTDAFFVVFKIPNFMRRLFADGAFANAFVPVLAEFRVKNSFAELRLLVDRMAGTLGVTMLALTLFAVVATPLLVMLFAPGFIGYPDKQALTVEMLRLVFPYLLFISLTAFAGSILYAYNRFAVPAFTPVLLNLSLISCALWLSPQMTEPVVALAWGVLIAGVAQLTFQLPFLNKLGLLPRPAIDFSDPGVKRVFVLLGPALIGVSVTQINLLLDTLFATFLADGSVSWLYYSDRLMEFPLGVLGIALATVILPSLSHRHAQASPEGFSHAIDWGLRWVLLLGMPAGLGLLLLAEPIIATLFESPVFDAEDIMMAGRSLTAYALGLVGFIMVKVLAPAFYARQDTRTPVRIAFIALFANLLLNLVLMFPLAHAGLALATTLSAMLNALLLLRALRSQGIYTPVPGWSVRMLRVVIACLVMAVLVIYGVSTGETWLEMARWERVWRLLLLIVTAAGGYLLTLILVGIRRRDFVE